MQKASDELMACILVQEAADGIPYYAFYTACLTCGHAAIQVMAMDFPVVNIWSPTHVVLPCLQCDDIICHLLIEEIDTYTHVKGEGRGI